MHLAVDPDNPHRRIAFDEREHAERYAAQLEPQRHVKPKNDPEVASITGRPVVE